MPRPGGRWLAASTRLLRPVLRGPAERFSSWYAAAEPRVALTFCDDSGRYWRVTKTFGGSTGRSELESSKDGQVFTMEEKARSW